MNYVGIDIHKRYSVCAAQDEQGRKLGVARIEGNLGSGFAQFLRGLGGPSKVVIEACWGWGKVHDVLEELPEVAEVVVANTLKTRLIAESQIKTDKIDGAALATLLRGHFISPVHVPPKAVRQRKDELRQRLYWARLRTRIRNRVHALLDRQREAALPQCSDLFGAKGMAALRALVLPEPDAALLREDLDLLEVLGAQIKAQEKRLAAASTADPATEWKGSVRAYVQNRSHSPVFLLSARMHGLTPQAPALTDSVGGIVQSCRYDVYGLPIFGGPEGSLQSISSGDNRFLFTGREWVSSLGMYDFRNRVQSPNLGRFLQTDPIYFDSDENNLYRYVNNNPINLIDPTGEIAFVPILVGIGIGMALDWAYDEFAADHVNDFINDNFDCETQANLRTAGSIIDVARSLKNPVRLGIKNGREAFNKVKDFRRWFHKEWKKDQKVPGGKDKRNPDMDLDEAYEQWKAEGHPRVK
jgi:RHS repeat-associated protein